MTSNRVGGPSPSDPDKRPDRTQEQHRKIEKVEKVKPIEEAENERARKKFKSFMEDDEKPETETRKPSPLETEFYSSGKKSSPKESIFGMTSKMLPDALNDIKDAIVASPSDFSPPNVTVSPPNEGEEAPPLPQSHNFWSHVDSPPDQPLSSHHYKETQDSTTRTNTPHSTEKEGAKHKKKQEKVLSKKDEIESIYGPPGKTVDQKEKTLKEKEKALKQEKMALAKDTETAQKKKTEIDSEQGKIAPPPLKEEEKKQATAPHLGRKEAKEAIFSPPPSKKDPNETVQLEFDPQRQGEGQGKEDKRKTKTIAIEEPSLTTLPNHIIPIAQAATVVATPYISPQTIPLFYQMVGTIYVMNTTPGVSKTEILLNSPSFANSKFFGATISIEKYATAPDSLNIRLTGTNEAVHTFNQNIPNLYAAFQNGNFNFRIGRITAEYSAEKPIFRRKEAGEGRSDSGGGDLKDERGKQ